MQQRKPHKLDPYKLLKVPRDHLVGLLNPGVDFEYNNNWTTAVSLIVSADKNLEGVAHFLSSHIYK